MGPPFFYTSTFVLFYTPNPSIVLNYLYNPAH
jgi:hypothetical protein